MQALIQALISQISNDAELTAVLSAAPAVYLTEAPESAALPLVILHVGPGRVSHDFSGDRITVAVLTFQVTAGDINIALGGAQRIGDLLDDADIHLSSGNLLNCRRTVALHPAMPGFNSLQAALYTASITVECQVFDAA